MSKTYDLRNVLVHSDVNTLLYEMSKPNNSDVVAVRWLTERSSRLYHEDVDDPIRAQMEWELRQAPEVPAEAWSLEGKSFIIAPQHAAYGLLVDQSDTVLRKLYCTDCYSELCYTDWYNEDAPLAEARLMPDGLDSEDEGYGEMWLPGWENAATVYNWCPYKRRAEEAIKHTEAFLHHPKYTAVVVVGDESNQNWAEVWRYANAYHRQGLPIIRINHETLCAEYDMPEGCQHSVLED